MRKSPQLLQSPVRSATSLKSKLVLSYLLVILGTVVVLSFAVSFAVQNYFRSVQIEDLRERSSYVASEIETRYRYNGGWNNISLPSVAPNAPALLVIVDSKGHQLLCSQPAQFSDSNCSSQLVSSALTQSLRDESTLADDMQVTVTGGDPFSSVYVSRPLQNGDQTIGAIFLTQPRLSPKGDFMRQINQSIIIAGLAVAVIAALCSYLFVRRFTRPLESLTVAADQMKHGSYAQRVTLPNSQDELGLLAQTFNEMADTIEADVTELRQQDQMRRDLIANIAHDLATPLTAIQGLSEALADDVISDPAARQETAQRIRREVQRLRRLVADVRQVTSLEGGQTQLDLAPLDLHSLVDETLIVIGPECEQSGITLYNKIEPDLPHVLADSDRVTQVLLNLLDNARRHTPAGGSISVGGRVQDGSVQVWVSDTGSGIDAADLPHIFERFYRADRSRTGATGGSGLGLAIVKAIIVAHGGTIWAESVLKQGTRVTFVLPVAAQAALDRATSETVSSTL